MKIFRFIDTLDCIRYGALTSTGEKRLLEGDIYGEFRISDNPAEIQRLLAPVAPTSIQCIGLNYRKHAEETGATLPTWPVLFHKPISALQHPQSPIILPTHLASQQVDFEAELAVIIGKTCKNASPDQALDYVLGYTCANDVSARDWQKQKGGGQWCRGKGFDTFCPLGPYLVTKDEITDPQSLNIRTRVNGELLQNSNTADMIFSVAELVSFLSGSTTLLPGTVILTGTPEGVGMARNPQRWLQAEDLVEIEIDSIGTLSNPVQSEHA